MDEKVHYLMLKYDPTSCQRKDCTQMLEVYVGSFFNVEISPRHLSMTKKISNVYLGLFFNVEI